MTVLPEKDQVGTVGAWSLPTSSDQDPLEFRGKLLAVVSSRKRVHGGHYRRPYARVGERCGVCRWFEPRIFRELTGGLCACIGVCQTTPDGTCPITHSTPGRYLVHRTGRSMVPGEVDLISHEWLDDPHDVIEALTTRPLDDAPFLSNPAADVLAMAALHDGELREAYRLLVEPDEREA